MATSTLSFDGGSRKALVDDIGIIFPLPQKNSLSGAQLYNSYRVDAFGAGRHVFIKFGDNTMSLVDLTAWATLIALVTVVVVDDTATYTVNLDAVNYPYVAQGGDGATEIVDGLVAAIPGGTYNAANDDDRLVVSRIDGATFPVTVAATAAGELSTVDKLSSGNMVGTTGYIEEDGILPTQTHIGLICSPGETSQVVVMATRSQAIPQQGK